jgi:hypothetical protein
MAVGQMMHDLSNSPAAGTVGRFHLLRRQSFDCGANASRSAGNIVNELLSPLGGRIAFPDELSYRVTEFRCH